MHSLRGNIIWLTGNSGAGKTTLAQRLRNELQKTVPVVLLDGDDLRATISRDEGFSAEDRRKHNLRVARLAALLRDQGLIVLVAVIAPHEEVRDEIAAICSPLWVYVKRSGLEAPDRPYEEPHAPDYTVDCDRDDVETAFAGLWEFLMPAPVPSASHSLQS